MKELSEMLISQVVLGGTYLEWFGRITKFLFAWLTA